MTDHSNTSSGYFGTPFAYTAYYGSKTPARLPQVDFPSECYSTNHWANEEMMLYDHFKAQSIQ